jgi:hypothetical protein
LTCRLLLLLLLLLLLDVGLHRSGTARWLVWRCCPSWLCSGTCCPATASEASQKRSSR